MPPIRRRTSPHAAALRRNATDVEQRLWFVLRDRRLEGAKFRRQATVGGYVVDFACLSARLIIELDGGQHGGPLDAERTRHLEAGGFRVLRFWNHDVIENFDGVLEAIRLALLELGRLRHVPLGDRD